MPTFYNFRENGVDYSFDDIFVPADLFRDGNLFVWGSNASSKLGLNSTATTVSTPVTTFAGGNNWKQVSAGSNHVAAIKSDGTLWTWGAGGGGRLGNGVTTNASTPVTTLTGGNNWKQVSCGDVHTAAIKTDGTLWTWGSGTSGQLGVIDIFSFRSTPVTTFAGGTNWADTATAEPEDLYTLSGGNDHTAAIKTDGTLWTWGSGTSGRLGNAITTGNISTPVTTFSGGTNWKQVSAGTGFTAAIKTDGTLWTWGSGGSGRLGEATVSNKSTPVTTFAGGTNWKQVSSGGSHTVAIKTDGTLWTWGSGFFGALGNGVTTGNRSTPVTTFAGGTNWKQVSTSTSHTAAIKTDGTLWTWGSGTSGRLGNAQLFNASTPVTTFSGGTNWKQVSAGNDHTAAIKTDGTLWTWGAGTNGRLGNAVTANRSTPVTTFAGGTNWKQVSSGTGFTAAIKTDGTLWTWGNGNIGQLGNAVPADRSTPVTTFAGGTNWKQVSSGAFHTIALRDDGINKELYVFGNTSSQELGINYNLLLQFIVEGTNWKQVSCGTVYTAAVKTNGTLWAWGSNANLRFGTNVTTSSSTPVTTFAGGNNWKQVECGVNHTSAVKTDGTLWTWGYNGRRQLGTNATTNVSTPVTTFAGGTNWKQVSAGYNHTAAIKTDGTLWVWGNNNGSQLGLNSTVTTVSTPVTTFAGGRNWKQVFCQTQTSNQFTVAVKTDGTLWTWGYGGSNRLGNAQTTIRSTPITTFAGGTNWKQVECGYGFVAACTYIDSVI